MEEPTFMTDINYRKIHVDDESIKNTFKHKHIFLTRFFKSLERVQGKTFKVTNGEDSLGEYKFPYSKIDFTDIDEFEGVVKMISYAFDEDSYQRLLKLIEKAKIGDINSISHQFDFEVDPIELQHYLGNFITTFKLSYKGN